MRPDTTPHSPGSSRFESKSRGENRGIRTEATRSPIDLPDHDEIVPSRFTHRDRLWPRDITSLHVWCVVDSWSIPTTTAT